MSVTATESDQMLKKALRLLYSSHPNSATELREMLDELIKQRYGPEKMLCNTLSKRHLEMEKNFPGRAATPPPVPPPSQQTVQNVDEIINLTNSPAKTISDSPDTVADSDDGQGGATPMDVMTAGDDDGNLKEFGDLNCCVCGEMVFTATNRLIECSKCGSLYHQECHKPSITNEEASEDQQHNWQCDNCVNKPSTSKAAGIIVIPDDPVTIIPKAKTSAASSRSSSSSNSSSPFYKMDPQQQQPTPTIAAISSTAPATVTTKSSHRSSPSSSKGSKEDRSIAQGSKTSNSSHEKTSSHSSSSRKSHSSSKASSKSSKHHDSSIKRKSK